jgi:hypothetical protein
MNKPIFSDMLDNPVARKREQKRHRRARRVVKLIRLLRFVGIDAIWTDLDRRCFDICSVHLNGRHIDLNNVRGLVLLPFGVGTIHMMQAHPLRTHLPPKRWVLFGRVRVEFCRPKIKSDIPQD